MQTFFRSQLLLAALAPLLLLQPSGLDARTKGARMNTASSAKAPAHPEPRVTMNAWTVGLAGGLLEGAPIRLAAEIARVADDGDNLHVLPIVTRGAAENVNSLLYLRGIDAAIINADVLDEYKRQVPDVQQRLAYVLNLFPSELHIFVRPEIHTLTDLVGKKVNFNNQGTAAAYSGPLIFSRLGLDVQQTFIPHQVALEQMRTGDMAAVVFITSKPVEPFVRGRWDPGFKFLPVPYESRLEDYYLPASLEASDYPSLIKEGEHVDTIAVPTALVAYNWQNNTYRYERVARFVDHLFSRISRLQEPGFDRKWKSINLGATVPGLTRFPAAQAWLDNHSRDTQASK
ncbi:TAXI family TRAP transporter solute-binding subunit [Bradyrhizobium sp. CB2312]|uniref:TAXI family TRAP transporter solute-binding subunit n=1 Tax=Bradyrhizobium sp. CB2312 TaxID=3039155 RepID=UPI0024B05EDF|nr:TAXI family TRAP transporter solute-binding subunit [Bradyrhizobium sp. CB2312]WFU69271.1 TAXI family TRAP transporter solute-binding subunit [Bradyrhizobium sp. CB2312]